MKLWRALLAIGVCLPAILTTPVAEACTAEASRIAARAQAKARLDLREVAGVYHVVSVERRTVEEYDGPREISTYYGTVISRRGKVYPVEHSDDGYIILCAISFKPKVDADGHFYLSRSKIKGSDRYELLDWDGDYLPSDGESKDARE